MDKLRIQKQFPHNGYQDATYGQNYIHRIREKQSGETFLTRLSNQESSTRGRRQTLENLISSNKEDHIFPFAC